MVVLKAFKAIRPRAELAEKVATLPYDVLSSAEARELAADNVYSFLHIDKSEVDLPIDTDVHAQAVYEKAATNLSDFLAKGWLFKEDSAQFYLYELTVTGRSQTGIVGVTSVADYENAAIKRHELTLPEKEADRIAHFLATGADTSSIFMAYHENAEIQKIVEDWKAAHAPIYDFTSFHNVRHRVFAVRDIATTGHLSRLFQKVPALYIADGHHRSASAVKVAQKLREKHGNNPSAPYNFFLSVVFPDSELAILDYNRVVKSPLPADFWEKISLNFEVEKIEKSKPTKTHEFHALTKEGWFKLVPKADKIPSDEVEALDVAILQELVLAPLLGIDDPKTNSNIEFVGGIRGLEALEEAVNAGASIAFALYPPALPELMAVADAGKIMPPKSTWFEPKLLSGLFLYDLKN